MDKYWPFARETLQFRDIDVVCEQEEEEVDYVRRLLLVRNDNEERKVSFPKQT